MPNDFRNNSTLSAGIRRNNPGNMRTGSDWKGEVGSEAGFCIFQDISYGIRAYLVNYHTNITIDGVKSLGAYISKYAPPTENNTPAYLQSMMDGTGLSSDDPLPTDQAAVTALMQTQFKVENGSDVSNITGDDYQAGFDLFNDSFEGFFLTSPTIPQFKGPLWFLDF